nr:MAG TPA: hypothetical protein [Bacteriophage sp.]DAN44528.1 MAG TPA: hypothetical protein [Bacteriophage sp.]
MVRDIITFKLGCTLYYHIVHVQDKLILGL